MKLSAIYSVWDSEELLTKSIEFLGDHVDLVIIVYQTISNFGENYDPLPAIEHLHQNDKVLFVKFEPELSYPAMQNERLKRNLGLQFAKANHCTHFLHIDCDEFYEDFGVAKKAFLESGHKGSVCRLHTYFKKPTLRFDKPEDYFVPFIHELREDTMSGSSSYKYWVDPTRTVNESDIIELPIFMHHFSWVRRDIMRKARNSSANFNDQRVARNKQIFEDYNSPNIGTGYFLQNWNRTLIEVPDTFGLASIFQ